MTKRRPWWSEWPLRVAVFTCGLLLLHGPSTVWAAGKKPVLRAAAAKKISSSRPKMPKRQSELPAETGLANILDSDSPGLHGHASFYGHGFQGRRTSTGERFDVRKFTAASNHFPLGSMVAVRRLDSALCAIVKINDRMHAKHQRRIIDVSRGAAEYLDMIRAGVVLVRVAALPADADHRAQGACRAAFSPAEDCDSCLPVRSEPPRLPDFGSLERGSDEP